MASNVGSQTVTIKYYDRVDSTVVNKRFKDIRLTGIYKGGWLSRSGSNITVSPLVCEIKHSTDGSHQVRVETAVAYTISSVTLNHYIVARWTYTGSATADYMELKSVATPLDNDLILGRYTAGGIDYNTRSTPNTMDLYLKVVEDNRGTSTKVFIRRGVVQSPSTIYTIYDQQIELSAYSGSTVYIYIDTYTGVVGITTSTAFDGKLVIASVAASADISTDDITDLRPFINMDHHQTQFASGSAAGGEVDKTVVLPFTPIYVHVWNNTQTHGDQFWYYNQVDKIAEHDPPQPFNKSGVSGNTITGDRSFTVNTATKTITFPGNQDRGNETNATFYYIAYGGGYNIDPS